jgi:hypothetical protein
VAGTLYDVLGVRPDASPDDLRRAYRELARALHPDRRSLDLPVSQAEKARFQAVNEAWRVLRDPSSRAAYDRSLLLLTRPPSARPEADEDDLDRPFRGRPVEPGDFTVAFVRSLPWLVIGLVLGAIFVFTAFASNEEGDPTAEDLLGACVVAENRVATVVPCTEENDGRVVTVATQTSDCPSTTTPAAVVADRWLCVRPLTGVGAGRAGP